MWSGFIIRGNRVELSGFHAAEFPRDVIPAFAGIQFETLCEALKSIMSPLDAYF